MKYNINKGNKRVVISDIVNDCTKPLSYFIGEIESLMQDEKYSRYDFVIKDNDEFLLESVEFMKLREQNGNIFLRGEEIPAPLDYKRFIDTLHCWRSTGKVNKQLLSLNREIDRLSGGTYKKVTLLNNTEYSPFVFHKGDGEFDITLNYVKPSNWRKMSYGRNQEEVFAIEERYDRDRVVGVYFYKHKDEFGGNLPRRFWPSKDYYEMIGDSIVFQYSGEDSDYAYYDSIRDSMGADYEIIPAIDILVLPNYFERASNSTVKAPKQELLDKVFAGEIAYEYHLYQNKEQVERFQFAPNDWDGVICSPIY